MKPKSHNSSLLTPENRGGVIGGKGYNFQDAFIASRLPEWLGNPYFLCLLKEGMGDVEVKFIESGREYIDFYQVKDHHVPPTECREVIETFFMKDRQLPNVYSKFILACRGLNGKAKSLRQAVEGLRGSYSMYESSKSVLKDTKEDIQACVTAIGLNVSVDFLREKVFFDTEIGDMTIDKRLKEQFIGSIVSRIQKWANINALSITAAYLNIAFLINRAIRRTLSREELEKTIQEAIDRSPQQIKDEVRIRLYHWEDPSFDLSEGWHVLLDWSEHFSQRTRKVPDSSIWQDCLIPDLEEAQKQIRASTSSKLIRFKPSACLSAGIALGWAFREVMQYTFEVQQGHDIWRSNLPISTECHLVVKRDISMDESSKDLCVEISQVADVAPKVDDFTRAHNKTFRAKITLLPDFGIGKRIDCQTALAYADEAKQAIRQAVDKYQCTTVHLFYAGPLGLAIFLGRLFNAMHADIQCYEEQNEGGYTPSCLLHTQ